MAYRWIYGFAILTLFPLAIVAQGVALPAGPGKAALEKICTGCHEMETTVSTRRTNTAWQATVDDMASRGAAGTPEELDAIVIYLTENVGKVNVNVANAGDLQRFLGIDLKEAQAIVEYRQKNGKFRDLDQLKKTPGADAAKLQEKRQLIAFSE